MPDHKNALKVRRLGFTKLEDVILSLSTTYPINFSTPQTMADHFGWRHCVGDHAQFYIDLVDSIDCAFRRPELWDRDPVLETEFHYIKASTASTASIISGVKDFTHKLTDQKEINSQNIQYYELANQFVTGEFYKNILDQEKSIKISEIRLAYEDDDATEEGMSIVYLYNSLSFETLMTLMGSSYTEDSTCSQSAENLDFLPTIGGSLCQWMEEYIAFVIAEIKRSQLLHQQEIEAQFLQAYLNYWEEVQENLYQNQRAAAIAMKNWLKTFPSITDINPTCDAVDTVGNVFFEIMIKLEKKGIVIDPLIKSQTKYSPQYKAAQKEDAIDLAVSIVENHGSRVTKHKLMQHTKGCVNQTGKVLGLVKYYGISQDSFEGRAISSHLKKFLEKEKIIEQYQKLDDLGKEEFSMPSTLSNCNTLKKINVVKTALEAERDAIKSNAFYAKCWKNSVLRFFGFHHKKSAEFFDKRMNMIEYEINVVENTKKQFAKYISKNIAVKIKYDINKKGVSKKSVVDFHNFVKEENNDAEVEFRKNASVLKQVMLFTQKNNLIVMDRDNVFLNHIRYQCCQEVTPGSVVKYLEEIVRYASMINKAQYQAVLILLKLLTAEFLPESPESFQRLEAKVGYLLTKPERIKAFMVQFVERIVYPLKRNDPRYRSLILRYAPHLDNVTNASTADLCTIFHNFIKSVLSSLENTQTITVEHRGEEILMCARPESVSQVISNLLKDDDGRNKNLIMAEIKKNLKNKTNAIYVAVAAVNDKNIFEEFFWTRWRSVFVSDADLLVDKDIDENDNNLFSSPHGMKLVENILQVQFEMVSPDNANPTGSWNKTLSRYIRAWGSPLLMAKDQYLECIDILNRCKCEEAITLADGNAWIENIAVMTQVDTKALLDKLAQEISNSSDAHNFIKIINVLHESGHEEAIQSIIEIYIDKKIENFLNCENNVSLFTVEEQKIGGNFFNSDKFLQKRDQFLLQYLHLKMADKIQVWDEQILKFFIECDNPALKWQFIQNLINENNSDILEKSYDPHCVPVGFFDELVVKAAQDASLPPQCVLTDMQQRSPEKYLAFFRAKAEYCRHHLLKVMDSKDDSQIQFIKNKTLLSFVNDTLNMMSSSLVVTVEDKKKVNALHEILREISIFCNSLQTQWGIFHDQLVENPSVLNDEKYVSDLENVAQNSRGAEKIYADRRANFFKNRYQQYLNQKACGEFLDKVLIQALDFQMGRAKNENVVAANIKSLEDNPEMFAGNSKLPLLQTYMSQTKPIIICILLTCRREFRMHRKTRRSLDEVMLAPTVLQENPFRIIDRVLNIVQENHSGNNIVNLLKFRHKFFIEYSKMVHEKIISFGDTHLILAWICYFRTYHQSPTSENEIAFKNVQDKFLPDQNKEMLKCALSILNNPLCESQILRATKFGHNTLKRFLHYAAILQDNATNQLLINNFHQDVLHTLQTGRLGCLVQALDVSHLFCAFDLDNRPDALIEELICIQKFIKFMMAPEETFVLSQINGNIIFNYFKKLEIDSIKINPKLTPNTMAAERAIFLQDKLMAGDLTEFKQYCQQGVIFAQYQVVKILIKQFAIQAPESEIIPLIQKIKYPEKITPLMRKHLTLALISYIRQSSPTASSERQEFVHAMCVILGMDFSVQEKLLTPQLGGEIQTSAELQSPPHAMTAASSFLEGCYQMFKK